MLQANLSAIRAHWLVAVPVAILVGLFVLAVWVGSLLWRQSPRAWIWATVLYALQVPVVTTPPISFDYFTGFALTLMKLDVSGWHLNTAWEFHVGAGGNLLLNNPAANVGLGVNLFALVAAGYLLMRGLGYFRSADLDGERTHAHPMTRPWSAIVAHYRAYPGDQRSIRALGVLAERISGSRLSGSLFAWTSMFDLCITQTDVTYQHDGPKLLITPVSKDRLEFRYEDTSYGAKQWRQTVDANEAWPCLRSFLERLRWLSSETIVSSDSVVGS